MFYVPYRLRELREHTTPRGPDFRKAKPVILDLSGNRLSLRLPRHNVDTQYDKPVHAHGEIDIYNSPYGGDLGAWRRGVVLHRTWKFVGPIFTGVLADMPFELLLMTRQLAREETLFDPRVFEREIAYCLTEMYGEKKSYWTSIWQAPANWRRHPHLPVFAASYDIVPKMTGSSPEKEFVFPLSNDCFVVLHFSQRQHMSGFLEEKDQLIDRGSMEQLCQAIIASTRLELSAVSQQQLVRTQNAHPDARLSEHMAPLKWTTPEEDEKHAYYLTHRDEF